MTNEGVAQSVAKVLQQQGQAAALVQMGEHTEMLAPGQYRPTSLPPRRCASYSI